MKTQSKYDFPAVGCYVDESSGSADDCNERTIKFAEQYGFESGLWSDEQQPTDADDDWSQLLSETADRAVDALNDLETRSFIFWCHEDNSLFLMADVDLARDDVGFVSSKSQDYPPDDYLGEWLHVSDHGNATLYNRTCTPAGILDTEIWGVV